MDTLDLVTTEVGWVRGAVLGAVAPWLAITGLVASFWSDQPLLLAAGGLAGGVAIQQALRSNPRGATDSDWWAIYRRETFGAGSASSGAATWCRRIAYFGFAVLAFAFVALVLASALSFLGVLDG